MREFSATHLVEVILVLTNWRDKLSQLPPGSIVEASDLETMVSNVLAVGDKMPKEWAEAHVRLLNIYQKAPGYWERVKTNIHEFVDAKPSKQSCPVSKKQDMYLVSDIYNAALSAQKELKIKEIICSDLLEMEMAIHDELRKRKFIMLDAEKSKLFNAGNKAWLNRIEKKLPTVKKDLVLAGNCLAMNLHTAAAFHSIRAAEIGMRELGNKLQVSPIREKKVIPIADATWNELIIAVNKRIESESKLPKVSRQIIKSGFRELRLLAQHLDMLKDTRNHVMHSHDFYNEPEAMGVFQRVKHFLQILAVKI